MGTDSIGIEFLIAVLSCFSMQSYGKVLSIAFRGFWVKNNSHHLSSLITVVIIKISSIVIS